MNLTKTQLIEEVKSQGFSEEDLQSITEFLNEFPEELSHDDLQKIDKAFEEMQGLAMIVAQVHDELIDELEDTEDRMLDAEDRYLDSVEQIQAQAEVLLQNPA